MVAPKVACGPSDVTAITVKSEFTLPVLGEDNLGSGGSLVEFSDGEDLVYLCAEVMPRQLEHVDRGLACVDVAASVMNDLAGGQIQEAARLFATLSEPSRLGLLQLLMRGPMTVTAAR